MTKRRTGFAVLAALLALVIVGGATAGSGAQATPWSILAHGGSATRYLKAIGVDPHGVVVQRGRRNYAGPSCPGKGWTCTSSKRVLQFGTIGGVNSVVCSASGGGGSVSSNAGSSSETCTIVQVSTSGANNATCTEQSSTTASGTVSQTCSIQQTSGSGKNSATVNQTLTQGPSACSPPSGTSALQAETGTQNATVSQQGPSGDASANVTQTASQCASTIASAVSESQATSQTFTISQGPVGFVPGTSACNNTGMLNASATQSQHQHGYAASASGGTQQQSADLIGHMDQCSSGVATYTANQNEDQALAPNSNVTQTQIGPTHFSGKPNTVSRAARTLQKGVCCSFQGTNGTDKCTITQTTSQDGNPGAVQTEDLTTSAGTSGRCTGNISGNQNADTFASTQTGQSFTNTVQCAQGACTGQQVPTTLTWTGDTSGTFHDGATLAATLTRNDTNAGVPGEAVTLGVGAESCPATTDGFGVASCSVTLGDTPGGFTASASFGGTSNFGGSSTSVGFTVLKAPTTTTLTYTGATSGDYHDPVTLSAHLAEADNPATGIARRTVTFTLGTQGCSGTTDASGDASCTVVLAQTPGDYTVVAGFDGSTDPDYTSSSTSLGFTILKAPTTLTYTGDTSADYNDATTLSAHLAEAHNPGTAIAAETVTFTLGTQSCSSTSDASGNVSCQLVISQTPGPYTVSASFDGSNDVYYTSDADSKAFTVTKEESFIVYKGATSGDYSDQVTLKGVLTEDTANGLPLAGEQLKFTIGSKSCIGTTTSAGLASCTLTIADQAGPSSVVTSFAGDADYQSSSLATPFTITHEEDELSYTGPTSGKKDSTVTVSAKLTHGSTGLGGRSITFTLGTQGCTGTTDRYGVATCKITLPQSPGTYTVKASFAGDSYYEPNSCPRSFRVTS